MSQCMQLKLTLRNGTPDQTLRLTRLAPQDGWRVPPPHQIAAGDIARCEIDATGELAITLQYGRHHIGVYLDDGEFAITPGDASVDAQKLDGNIAEVSLTLPGATSSPAPAPGQKAKPD